MLSIGWISVTDRRVNEINSQELLSNVYENINVFRSERQQLPPV